MSMATLEKVILTNRELSDLRKIQDSYEAEAKTIKEQVSKKMEAFWLEVRKEHDMGDDPFHVMGGVLWRLRDATKEEQDAYLEMTRYK